MGPKKKVIITKPVEAEGDTPPPMVDEPILDNAKEKELAPALNTNANPIQLDDLEDEVAEENADLAAAANVATASSTKKGTVGDPIATLLTTFYETSPYIVKNGVHHELEVRFGTRGIQQINKMDFDAVVQIIKSNGFTATTTTESGQYSLRIQNEFIDNHTGRYKVSDNIRTEIYGMNAIQLYCRTNDIQTLLKTDKSSVKFTNKHSAYISNTRVPNAVMEDFNFVVSYKVEEDVKPNIQTFMSENWQQFKKHFRYLNRVTFTHPDLPILVDMSIVKTSPKIKRAPGANGPGGYQMHYTTGEAGVFNAPESYEIELELDPSQIGPGTAFNTIPKILSAMKQAIKLVLSGLQHTNYPVAYSEQQRIQLQYMRLLHGAKYEDSRRIYKSAFIGPSSFTLQLPNIVAINENSTQANIRQDFVVTEKADGERHLLYIGNSNTAEAGRVYLINTNMTVIFTGAKTTNKELFGTLLDGELILRDKNEMWLNLFAAFDIYYLKGADVRALPFIAMDSAGTGTGTGTGTETAKKDAKQIYRHDLLKQVVLSANMVNVVESMTKMNTSPLRLDYKKFYSTGGVGAVIDNTNAAEKASNPAIFMACAALLQRHKEGVYPYNIDGLIFTHAHYGVGANERNKAGPLKKITWGYSFKWKPPHYNTIDFLVSTVKNESGEDLVRTKFEDGQNADPSRNLMQYKTVQLRSMYIERIHGFINPCQMIYDGDVPDYSMNMDDEPPSDKPTVKQFYPTAPYDPDAGIAFLDLKMDNGGNMQMYTSEGDIIEDDSVVEFAYNFNCDKGWRWVPLRVRHDKSENAYHVANDIWKNIHNPITDEMISTGLNIPEEDVIDADVYYNKTEARTVYLTNHLKIFHNFLKKVLIEAVAKGRGLSMIDMACGKAGDLPKWISAKLGFVFGIDLSRDNLENPMDGACSRYLVARKKNKVVPDCLFVQGNSAFNIRSGEALLSDKAVQISRAVFGQGEKSESKLGAGVARAFGRGASGFNIASMQFALHYMFASERDLTNFARNLAECVALGGYFIATFYDGKTVFNMLRDKQQGEMVSLYEGDKQIWGIVKQYEGTDTKLPDNVSSVGLKINVFQESINQWIVEYLVNFNYFTRVMEEYGFALPVMEEANALGLPNATGMFDVIYNKLVDTGNRVNHHRKFGDEKEEGLLAEIAAMTESERKISFLNRYCVFKKVRAVEAQKIKIDKLGDYNEFDKGAPPLHLDATTAVAVPVVDIPAPKIRKIVKKRVIDADQEEAMPAAAAVAVAAEDADVGVVKKKAVTKRKKVVIE